MFVVAPAHRHRGIGHDLFAHSLRRAEALACKRLEVHLPAADEERVGFFKSLGFSLSEPQLFVRQLKTK
jgi:GNAT superfamily N-acetyltransferase